MGEVALNVTLFHFFMLVTIIALYAFFSPLDVLASPPIDRQEIQNSNGWVQIPLPQFSDVNIHDGRKLYFNTARDISQCKSSRLLSILPNLTSVSYFSNGKNLDTTFWIRSYNTRRIYMLRFFKSFAAKLSLFMVLRNGYTYLKFIGINLHTIL
jgi:hypothetical protein